MAERRIRFSREQELAIIEQLAYDYQVEVEFTKLDEAGGLFLAPNTLVIDERSTRPLEVFFHELGHYHCYRNKIFPAYHRSVRRPKMYSKQAVLSTAFRAEKWVDQWAERECHKYFPNYEWEGSFRTDADRRWLNNYYQDDTVFDYWYR